MTGGIEVAPDALLRRSRMLVSAASDVGAVAGGVVVHTAESGLPELPAFGILGGIEVLAQLAELVRPAGPCSLPDAAARLGILGGDLAAAAAAYSTVDAAALGARATVSALQRAASLAVHEVPTVNALALVTAWDGERTVLPARLRPLADRALDLADEVVEGRAHDRDVSTSDLAAHGVVVGSVSAPAADLASMLRLVAVLSSNAEPSTFAVLHVGSHPPRYVVCLPGLQQMWHADGSGADLAGAIATITGHSSYIAGVRRAVAGLPRGSQVLLVGHSQGGMVAEAIAADSSLRRRGVTVAGVLTAGSPRLASDPLPGTAYVALENSSDPVPRLRDLADGPLDSEFLQPRPPGSTVVRFGGTGSLQLSQHDLVTGGYIATAASDDGALVDLRSRVAPFFTRQVLDARYVQVTDGGPP